jgi:hypothetical protein
MRNVALAMGRAGQRQPVAVVQPQDRYADCAAISAEIEANKQKVPNSSWQGLKAGQNVAAVAAAAGAQAPTKELGKELCGAALRDGRITQGVGWERGVLALRSLEPNAFDNFVSIGGRADDGDRHPRAPGFQLHGIADLERHFRPRIPRALDWPHGQ